MACTCLGTRAQVTVRGIRTSRYNTVGLFTVEDVSYLVRFGWLPTSHSDNLLVSVLSRVGALIETALLISYLVSDGTSHGTSHGIPREIQRMWNALRASPITPNGVLNTASNWGVTPLFVASTIFAQELHAGQGAVISPSRCDYSIFAAWRWGSHILCSVVYGIVTPPAS